MFLKLKINRFGKCVDNIDDAFMIRWVVFRSKRLKIFIHNFLFSDTGPAHSHPFSFISIMLKGSYIEQVVTPTGIIEIPRKAPSIMFRDAYSFHKIKITDNKPWTICIAFSAGKNWHYMVDGEQIKWRKYLRK